MNIAVVFEGDLEGGGGFQQQLSTLIQLHESTQYSFTAFTFSKKNQLFLIEKGIDSVFVELNFVDKLISFLLRQEYLHPFCAKIKLTSAFEKILEQKMIDLVYFLSPSFFSLELQKHNYLLTVWDLCHRDTPEFPEVNFFREFEMRERLYTHSLKKAVAILVDSDLGKNNVIRRYGIDAERIHIAPFSPSININLSLPIIDIHKKYSIDGAYIYYPAQFWSHKNHVYIIDAIAILKREGIHLTAIFSGSDKGNLSHVLQYAQCKEVENNIKYIGFAPNEEIYSLYKSALAMVMPSYFGPTNIPPLEAFATETPVVYSDLKGLREQVGNAALLCNLDDPKTLADHLRNLLISSDLRESLIQNGRLRLRELEETPTLNILKNIFDSFAIKAKCWKL